MKVLSYDPSTDAFLIAVTWGEYRQLAAKYKIEMEGAVEEVIESYKRNLSVPGTICCVQIGCDKKLTKAQPRKITRETTCLTERRKLIRDHSMEGKR